MTEETRNRKAGRPPKSATSAAADRREADAFLARMQQEEDTFLAEARALLAELDSKHPELYGVACRALALCGEFTGGFNHQRLAKSPQAIRDILTAEMRRKFPWLCDPEGWQVYLAREHRATEDHADALSKEKARDAIEKFIRQK
jgi:hypothetical protein